MTGRWARSSDSKRRNDRGEMKYIALLRGINVGNSAKVNMKELKARFEEAGFRGVSTYINSGNVFFESDGDRQELRALVEKMLFERTGSEIKVLIKTKAEIIEIAESIPAGWTNDEAQKTDVAYLFEPIDRENIVDDLPIRREFVNVLYAKGALLWNVRREDYHKSQINKIISHAMYKDMTVRNVNTARYLASVRA